MIGALSILAPIAMPIINSVIDTLGGLAKGAVNTAVDTATSSTKTMLNDSMPSQKNNQITY